MMPDTSRKDGIVVDLLLARTRAGGDGKAHHIATADGRQKHVIARARAEIKNARPGRIGVQLHPGRDGKTGQAADDTGWQVHIVARTAVQADGVATMTSNPSWAVHQRAGPTVPRCVGSARAARLVKLQLCKQGRREVQLREGVGVEPAVVKPDIAEQTAVKFPHGPGLQTAQAQEGRSHARTNGAVGKFYSGLLSDVR